VVLSSSALRAVFFPRRGSAGQMDDHNVAESAKTAERQHSDLAEISREMVRLYKEQFGRGPTKAKTSYAGPDVILCTLENSFTPAERKLAEMGEHQRLRDTRLYFQYATADDFRSVIERILGRKVRGFNSGVDTDRDISVEVFHLEPSDQHLLESDVASKGALGS
jgi:uncharacterized protein YbcI